MIVEPLVQARVEGVPVTIRLESQGAGTLPRLEGLNVFLEEDVGCTDPDYLVRVDRVIPSRAGPPPLRRAAGPFCRYRAGAGFDLVMLRGGTVRLEPGGRVARLVLRGVSRAGAQPWQGEAVLVALQHALALHGWGVLHAAAFEVGGIRLLVVGGSHAGKSTLCMAALAAGGRVVSDDWVAVGVDGGGGPVVIPLRKDVWLREGSLEIVRGVAPGPPDGLGVLGEGRWRLRREDWPEWFAERLRPEMIVRLHRDRRRRSFMVRRTSAAEALAELIAASSPLFFTSRYVEERAMLLPVFRDLAGRFVSLDLRMGSDLIEQPGETMERLVDELRAALHRAGDSFEEP